MTEGVCQARHRAAIHARLLAAGAELPDPGGVAWKINREVVVIAGWGRAILLQLAHPLIAAGIAEHSSFRSGPLTRVRRLASTIGAMLALSFGTDDEMIETAARINGIHDRVSGRCDGQRYSAHDPELLRWVHATLLDSIPLTYERLIGPLTTDERDRYCAQAAIMEPLLDIPAGHLPRSGAQLDDYVRDMLASGRVAVGVTARSLAHAILFPPGWRLMWPVFRPLQLLTIGSLPPAIREGYGFTWTARDARALARWTATLRRLLRMVPPAIREWPAARRRPSPRQGLRAPGNPAPTKV